MKKNPYNNQRWRNLRKRFLDANPLCVKCKEMGFVTVATTVDHKKPHKGNEKMFWDESNLQGLCSHCHSAVKKAEEGGGRAYDTACDVNGFSIDSKHPWSSVKGQ